jgi:hypothetical protein
MLLDAFGGGFTWGSALVPFNSNWELRMKNWKLILNVELWILNYK